MDEWKRQILDAVKSGRASLANEYARAAIQNPENKISFGEFMCGKKYYMGVIAKNNVEAHLLYPDTKNRLELDTGDVIAVKYGDLYIVGIFTLSDDEIGIKTLTRVDCQGEEDFVQLRNGGANHVAFLFHVPKDER
ncbi:hypothetical protein [Dehalobacter restrictus]|uniref:hypothetical protein n=1 Tax=Dehalobacter restrictus TaxID=55583 RepID=UPI00338D9BCD